MPNFHAQEAFEVSGYQPHSMLDSIQQRLYKRAQKRAAQYHHTAEKLDQFAQQLNQENGMYQTGWCGSTNCEEQVKLYKGTIRCLLEEKTKVECFSCDKKSMQDVLIAKAY